MKRILPLLVIGIFLLSGLQAIALSTQDIKTTTISFSRPQLIDHNNYIDFQLSGTNSVLRAKNHYQVPTYIQTFTFPIGTQITNVQCIPQQINSQVLTKPLPQTPEPVLATTGEKIIESSPQLKTIGQWYKYDIGMGIVERNERAVILKVEVYPVQYHPETQMIEWAENVDIMIEYTKENGITNREDNAFIILTPSDFESSLTPLVTHKTSQGLSVKMVSLDDIYDSTYFPVQGRDSPEKIKYFIKNAIETWGTSYVLLVGGSAKFPTRLTHVHVDSDPPDDELFVTDLYYADIYDDVGGFATWDTNENDVFGEYDWGSSHNFDDVDLYPDVYLSRLACTSTSQVTTVVNKIITYEEDVAYTQPWFNNLIVVGGDSFPGDAQAIDEGEYVNDAVIDVMDGFTPTRLWASLGMLSGLVPSGVQRINDAIDAGAGFVDFSGHGNTQVWATHPHENAGTWLPSPYGQYTVNNINSLSNGDKLPIVVTGACSVAKYNQDSSCFSWSLVAKSGGGAIGSLGATGLGWAYIGTGVTSGLIEGIALDTFKAYKDDGAATFGEMWAKAVENYIGPGMEGTDYKTVEEWQPFGDPTLVITSEESQAPAKPLPPNGPSSGKANTEYTYTASTTDPDNDKIYYMFDWGDGEFSGWVGPYNSGSTGSASHTWTVQGDYQIKVRAKDDHNVLSEWSDPLPISMPRSRNFISSFLLDLLDFLLERFPLLQHFLSFPLLN